MICTHTRVARLRLASNTPEEHQHRTRYVYFAHHPDHQPVTHVKIGISKAPASRLRQIGLTPIFAIECEWRFARQLEQALHKQFQHLRVDVFYDPRFKTVRGSGSTEWFEIDARLRQLILVVYSNRKWPWNPSQRILVA